MFFSLYFVCSDTSYPLTLNILLFWFLTFPVTNEKKHSDSNKAVIYMFKQNNSYQLGSRPDEKAVAGSLYSRGPEDCRE